MLTLQVSSWYGVVLLGVGYVAVIGALAQLAQQNAKPACALM
jgi:hypothetical protein